MSDSVGSVSVEVVPDARGWSEKLRSQLRDQKVEVKAEADTTEANAELDKTARTRTAKVKVNVDKNPLEQGAGALDKFVGKLGVIPALAIAGTAALVPLAGTLGGIAAALAAPLAIAGGGATLFGVLAGFAVKDTEKQLKVIDSAQKKLDGLTKGTKAYAAQAKVLADAQKSLSPAQRQFSDAQSNFGASFQNFIGGKAGSALLAPLVQGMNLLSTLLPHLTPIITAASGAFSSLLGGIGKATSSPGFDKFIHTVSGQVGHDIEGFGHAAGNIAKGLGGLFVVLDKSAGGNMVDELVKLTGAFSHWANSDKGRKAVQDFLGYAHRVGPGVGDALGAVARATGHFVEALAPLGPPILRIVQGLADGFSQIPIPVLTALAGAFVGMVAFQKVGGFKGIGLLGKLAGAGGGPGGVGGLLSGSVQKVYVVNLPPELGGGGLPGVPGGPRTPGVPGEPTPREGALSKAGKWAGAATGLAILDQFKQGAYKAAGNAWGAQFGTLGRAYAFSVFKGAGSILGGPSFTGLPHVTPMSAVHAASSVFGGSGGGPDLRVQPAGLNAAPRVDVRAATTGLDSVAAAAARASRQVERIGPNSQASLGKAVHAVQTLSGGAGPLASLHAQAAKASQNLERIGPNAQAGSAQAVKSIGNVKSILAAIHDKRVAVKADTAAAEAGIGAVQRALNAIDRVVTVHVNVTRFTNATVADANTPKKHARGGWIDGPGTGTSDSVPSWLSKGEFVVNAQAAAQNRALLDQINSGRRSYSPSAAAPVGGGMGGGPTYFVLDDGTKFRGHVESIASGVIRAHQTYDRSVSGL